MKNLRKLAAILIALMLVIQCLPATAAAAATVESGKCGDNLTWKLDDAGTLTISGSGTMEDFSDREAPWYDMPVKKIVVQSGVTSIGNCAFADLPDLTSISLPSSLKSLGSRAIYNTGITQITLPKSVRSIGREAFARNFALQSINIPNGIKEIPTSAFENCSSLEEIVIPDSVTSIDFAAFRGCTKLANVQLSSNLESIGSDAFRNCNSFEIISLPDSVTTIEGGAFMGCSNLVGAYLPANLTVIPRNLFLDCYRLEFVFLPANLTRIETSAFSGCDSLTEVYFLGDEEQLKEIEIYSGNEPLLNAVVYLATIITQQPNDVAVEAGETATFTVAASRDDVTYQWYYAAPEDEEFTECTGSTAKSATLKVKATEDMNSYIYCCVVTDEYGSQVQTRNAMLVVSPKPKVTSQPKDVTVKYGEKATVKVSAKGDGLTYQWYSKNPGASKFSKASITGSTYSVTMDETRDGRQVYCLVTDAYGRSVKSEVATLNLERTKLSITTQPKDTFAYPGEKATVKVVAAGDGLTYQWYSKNPGASKFGKASITKNVYSVIMDETRDGRQVYCQITDAYGNTATTNVVTLTMEEHPITIVTQPASTEVNEGEKATVEVVAEGEGLTYQWYIKNTGASKFAKASITKPVYSVTMDETRDGRQLYCLITDVNGVSIKTATVTISMYKAPIVITQQPEDIAIRRGEEGAVSVAAEGVDLTYQWYVAAPGSDTFTASAVTGNVYTAVMDETTNGSRVYCVITDRYGKQATSDTVTISMYYPPLVIVTQPVSVTVERGQEATVAIEVEGEDLTYQWYIKNPSNERFHASSITTNEYSVTMDASRDGRQVYCVVSDSYGQSAKSDVVTLSMQKPALTIVKQPENVTVELGQEAAVSVEVEGQELTYQWYIKNRNSKEFAKSSTTTSTYSVVMDESRHGRQLYCVISDGYGQTVTTDVVTISASGHELNIVKQPEGVTVAYGETVKLEVIAEGYGLSYQWYHKDTVHEQFIRNSVTKSVYSITMDHSRSGRQLYCVITDMYGQQVTTDTVTIYMEQTPIMVVEQPRNVRVLDGDSVSITFWVSGDGVTYQWYVAKPGSDTFYESSNKSDTYRTTMSASVSGRRVYCVATDKYGNSVTSDIVTMEMR